MITALRSHTWFYHVLAILTVRTFTRRDSVLPLYTGVRVPVHDRP